VTSPGVFFFARGTYPRRLPRFRTYFPDAYKQHYPNAKTHLSSRIRASLPDGKSLFEKTRSKKRRPFTEEEDRALRAGYEKHGTLWAQIVKDPIFQEQKRRSTDLRDRFRNAFPDLYEAAGYKPRPVSKKKRIVDAISPLRAATDDQIPSVCLVGPSRRKRANTNEGLFRRGTKSVPQSATNSDNETSGDEMDGELLDVRPSGTGKRRASQPLPMLFRDVVMDTGEYSQPIGPAPPPNPAPAPALASAPAPAPDIAPSSSQISDLTDSSQSQMWCSAPVDPNQWPGTNPGSPTSSHVSNSETFVENSPFRPHMIGKSAWGAQDWFSANPRLGQSMPLGLSNDGSIYGGGGPSPTPSSPFSFHTLSHGVFDRYDLVPTSFPHDASSEVGLGDTHSAFSDLEMFTSSNFRGFTHHSNYAGDLIFGTRSHQPQQHFEYGVGESGLGLSGVPVSDHHPFQLPGGHLREIELNAMTLQDSSVDTNTEGTLSPHEGDSPDHVPGSGYVSPRLMDSMDPIAAAGMSQHSTPPATPIMSCRTARTTTINAGNTAAQNRSLSVPPSEHRPTISYHRQTSDQSNLAGKIAGAETRNSVGTFEHITSVQPHQLHQFGSTPGRDSNGHLNMPSIHAQLGTGTGTNAAGTSNGGSTSSSSLADALKPQSGDDVVNLAFLDLHNYGSFGGHHGMGAPSYGSPGTGTSAFGYTMERQGQAQALDLATNFLTNGYLPSPNAPANQNQSRTINPMLTQQVSIPPHVRSIPSNGTTTTTNVMPSYGSTRQVSQPPPPPPFPPVHEQMVGVERTGLGRSASVQPRGLGVQSHSSFSSHNLHSRGLSAVVSPHDLLMQKSVEGERGRKRASWGSGMVGERLFS